MDGISRINLCSVGSAAPGLSLVTLLRLVFPSRAPSLPDSPPFCWSCYKPIRGTLIRSDVWYLWASERHPAGGKVVEGTRSTSPASLAGALLPCSREAPQVLATAPWTDAHHPPSPTLCPLNGPLHFSVTHGFTWKHWTAITCLFRVNEFCRFLFMDLLFLLRDAGMYPGNRVFFDTKELI